MLQKTKILERLINGVHRFFKVTLFSRQVQNLAQFHSGGDDYNPPELAEGLSGNIGENPADSIIFAWRDAISRKSKPGEKRIYSVDINDPNKATTEVYLRNDGIIEINADKDLNIVVVGNCNLQATSVNVTASASVNIDSPVTNVGVGGKGIARLDDEVEVYVTGGSSTGTWKGKIISSGVNTSI